MKRLENHLFLLKFIFILFVFLLLYWFIDPAGNSIFWRLPPLIQGLPLLINSSVEYLMFDWLPIQVYDPEIEEFEQKPLLKEVTRTISNSIIFLILLLRDILLGGVETIVFFYKLGLGYRKQLGTLARSPLDGCCRWCCYFRL